MADTVHSGLTAAVHTISHSPYAPGEISPIIAVGVSYPSEPNGDVPIDHLIARYAPALDMEKATAADLVAAEARFHAAAPARPEATYYKFGDPIGLCDGTVRMPDGRLRTVYCERDIVELRAVTDPQSFNSCSGQPFAWRLDLRAIKRKDDILSAWDAWITERARVADEVGWSAANAAHRQARDDLQLVEARIVDAPTLSILDITAKAKWIEGAGKLAEYSFVIVWDVLSLEDTRYRLSPVARYQTAPEAA